MREHLRCRIPRRQRPHGFVLIVVVLVLMGVLLAATGLLYSTSAAQLGRRGDAANVRTALLADSAIVVVSRELALQRNDMLAGRTPVLQQRTVLFELNGRQSILVLLPIDAQKQDELLAPESAKLDLNSATEAMLAAMPGLDESFAKQIVAARAQRRNRRFASVRDLCTLTDLSADLIMGSDLDLIETPSLDGSGQPRDRAIDVAPTPREPHLDDLLTVHAHEPNVTHTGEARLNAAGEWNEELRSKLTRNFGEPFTAALEPAARRDDADDRAIIGALHDTQHPREEWNDVLDALTLSPSAYFAGRINLNEARRDVLACIPGITPESADSLVQVRETLDDDERATITWPMTRGVLAEETFMKAAPHLTARSWVFRLRFALVEGEPGETEGTLAQPQVRGIFEIIIDLSEPQPRVLQRRDLTHWNLATQLIAEEADSSAALDAFAAR